jgi:hypothetical protein
LWHWREVTNGNARRYARRCRADRLHGEFPCLPVHLGPEPVHFGPELFDTRFHLLSPELPVGIVF